MNNRHLNENAQFLEFLKAEKMPPGRRISDFSLFNTADRKVPA